MHILKIKYETKLLLILALALLSFFSIEFLFTSSKERNDVLKMKEAMSLAETWFNKIELMKKEKGISSDIETNIKHSGLIGNYFTDITTTLGSLEAKEISTNPEFAALIVRYLTDSNIDSTKKVGVILSGSFPSLSISSLAAIQTLKAKAIIFSSLGASMFGANQPGATWLDIENYLIKSSGLKYRSNLVTPGAEADNGGGLSGKGVQILKTTAANYNVDLYLPHSLKESIDRKVDILLNNKIDLLINIGGNQTSLGACVHSLNIPNGFHKKIECCNDEDRGVIMQLNEKGIPFINLLNIKDLAIKNELSINPSVASLGSIYKERKHEKIPAVFSLIILSGLIFLIRKKKLS